MPKTIRTFYSASQISEELGENYSRVTNIIKTRKIPHVGRVGVTRVFSPEAIDHVSSAIREIEASPRNAARKAAIDADRNR